MSTLLLLVSGATDEQWLISPDVMRSRHIKDVLKQIAVHPRTNTVKGKQTFIDGLRVAGSDQRLAYWLEGEIKRRYGVNDLDRAIEAAVHEMDDVISFMQSVTAKINANNNPFAGGRVSMGSLFGFGIVAPTFTSMGDLFSKYPNEMRAKHGK